MTKNNCTVEKEKRRKATGANGKRHESIKGCRAIGQRPRARQNNPTNVTDKDTKRTELIAVVGMNLYKDTSLDVFVVHWKPKANAGHIVLRFKQLEECLGYLLRDGLHDR